MVNEVVTYGKCDNCSKYKKRYFKAGDGTTVHALDGVSMEIKKEHLPS